MEECSTHLVQTFPDLQNDWSIPVFWRAPSPKPNTSGAWMRLIFLMSHFQVSQDLDESFSSLSRLGWVTFKSLKTWMSHFQVSRDLDESLSSLSRLGWVTLSHFQVSQDLDESLSSLSRLGWGLERRGTGSLSSSVDCCYSNQLDLLRVETRVCSYNFYATPFLSFPSHLTSVKFIKLKRTQSV